ncbi:C-terminal binding protein [Telmatocola sphagniphila]|uniref:C-terminal binding protein n=1 Tax=Telmatocola sphagniphila TaxID=1123043 RepID=A0A8E6B986_9BACT|nr:C-terminal binding protein [Telmatocola sphagniphila]QVL33722.1 C-terminal binding protein [Telmatocola sphagniphila]
MKVVISDFIHDSLQPEKKILGDLATVESLNGFAEAELWGRIDEADAIMMYHNLALTSKTIERLKNCKLIVRCGVGIDNVDWKFARTQGIPVANVPDYGSEEVADTALGMLLSLTRGISFLNQRLIRSQGEYSYSQVAPLRRLRGQTCGVIGVGRIGTAFVLRAKALNMRVVFYDPYVSDGVEKALGVERVNSLEELLQQSYAVSVHCPLTPETRHLINAQTIELLPKGSFLVNTARGAIVDTTIIPQAIASGRLAGAGIDVLADEPPEPENPLVLAWRDPQNPCHDRVILNPHSAFYSEEGLTDMRVKGSQACRNALLGLPLRNVVN